MLIASVDRDKECPFSGVTNCGRVWRKVPESSAQFGGRCRKAVLSLEEGAGKQCSECVTLSSQLQAAFILNEQFSADIGEKNYS